MATREALTVFLESLASKSYYAILGVLHDADPRSIKSAFHGFSLLYHPDRYVDSPGDVRDVATAIFKRGVESYRCLSKRPSRERYDGALLRGQLRLDGPGGSGQPRAPDARTLETIATTLDGKQFARKADRFLAIGHLDPARVQLVNACQCEPYNEELAERLQILYEALALEPS